MKTMTLTIMMLSGVYENGKTASYPTKNRNVSFSIVVEETIKQVPYLIVFQEGVFDHDAARAGQKKFLPTRVKGNSYFFNLQEQNKPLYFSVMLPDENNIYVPAIKTYHFEPGDQMNIRIKRSKINGKFELEFSGRGSAKYRCRYEFYHHPGMETAGSGSIFTRADGYGPNNREIIRLERLYDLVEKYRPKLSVYSYNLLHADVIGSMGYYIFDGLRSILVSLRSKSDSAGFKFMVKSFREKFRYDFTKNVPENILYDSKEYADFLLARFEAESMMDSGSINYSVIFKHIKMVDNDLLRGKLILSFFFKHWSFFGDDFSDFFKYSLASIKDEAILARIKVFENNQIGSISQNFSLTDSHGKMVSLTAFKGKVVFIDFWYTGCGLVNAIIKT